MELKTGMVLNRTELSEFFRCGVETFSKQKEQKLKELRLYCNYNLVLSPKGNFKRIEILEVFYPRYRKLEKVEFLNWLDNGGIEEVCVAGGDWVFSLTCTVNYYCEKRGIPYQGRHYESRMEKGHSDNTNRAIQGFYKVENKDYFMWHYLYSILRKYSAEHELLKDNHQWVDCCSSSYNPTSLRRTTEEDIETRRQIYETIFGKISFEELKQLIDEVENEEERDELIENRLMRKTKRWEKLRLGADMCVEKGVLFRRGFVYKNYNDNRFNQ